jgi:hypothetical protein
MCRVEDTIDEGKVGRGKTDRGAGGSNGRRDVSTLSDRDSADAHLEWLTIALEDAMCYQVQRRMIAQMRVVDAPLRGVTVSVRVTIGFA